ncbi:lipopolysaccharide assembly protein LapA domain-containing protein [Polymorphobacter sp.]|uniref:lipopolysaccharide assembly protein LapA domain-containing protein n=1 Tax=Polymorphobacter sp. TaxID=1909290 RepID=UPI003F6FACB9
MIRWIILVAVVALFLLLSVANWTLVPFLLPQGHEVMIPLPLIIAAAFLAGWLPTWLSHLATTTRLRRKLERQERQLADYHRPPAPVPPPET